MIKKDIDKFLYGLLWKKYLKFDKLVLRKVHKSEITKPQSLWARSLRKRLRNYFNFLSVVSKLENEKTRSHCLVKFRHRQFQIFSVSSKVSRESNWKEKWIIFTKSLKSQEKVWVVKPCKTSKWELWFLKKSRNAWAKKKSIFRMPISI